MDSDRFDTLTRVLSSRRTALGGLLGGAAALLGLAGAEEASAHNPVAGCRRIDDPVRRRRCLRQARAHNRKRHSCKAQPVAVTCSGRCGSVRNNCRKAVTCPCPAGKTCLGNGSCTRTCFAQGGQGDCPFGCLCGLSSAEGGIHCIPANVSECEQVPQVCASSVQCPLGTHCVITGCGPDGIDQGRCVPVCPI